MDHLTIYRAPTPARHPRIIVLSEKQTKKLKLEIVLSEKQTKGLKVEEFCCNPFVRLFVPQWHQNGVKKNQACWARSPVGVDKETNKMRKNSIISILQGELWPFCTQWTFFSKSHWQQIKFWQWLFQDGVHIFQSMMYISSSCGIDFSRMGTGKSYCVISELCTSTLRVPILHFKFKSKPVSGIWRRSEFTFNEFSTWALFSLSIAIFPVFPFLSFSSSSQFCLHPPS